MYYVLLSFSSSSFFFFLAFLLVVARVSLSTEKLVMNKHLELSVSLFILISLFSSILLSSPSFARERGKREREGEREMEGERERVCVCVCVCHMKLTKEFFIEVVYSISL